MNVLFDIDKIFSVENIKNHEENVRRSNDIANTIRDKVADLIEKIKQEETKLLNNVQQFSASEQR
jgi:23S rRNA G2445 N2-methylase RlmL